MRENAQQELFGQAPVDERLVVFVEDSRDLPAVAAAAAAADAGVAVGIARDRTGGTVAEPGTQGMMRHVDLIWNR